MNIKRHENLNYLMQDGSRQCKIQISVQKNQIT
jgi:hypothetical protein